MPERPDPTREALRFLADAREDEALAARARSAGTVEDVVRLAAAAGYAFAPDDLRRAHRADWGLRWARYATAPRGPSPS
jgi:predicted ribosomally synthesized peptide with nif11-like leader